MNTENYRHYNVEDFMEDHDFRRYILELDKTNSDLWQRLRSEDQRLADCMDEAEYLLRSLQMEYNTYKKEGQHRARKSYHALESRVAEKSKRGRRQILYYISAAAAVLVIIFGTVFLWPEKTVEIEVATAANEVEDVILPDGSVVYLNENTQLSFAEDWDPDLREVRLNGNAYFMVRAVENGVGQRTKFTVKTGGLDVEVLGTQFNIKTGDSVTTVTLDEGRVRLIKDGDDQTFLEPGETASFNHVSKELTIRESITSESENYWKPEAITFNQITLRDALIKIEAAFDLDIMVDDARIRDLKIDRLSIPSDDPEVFIETLRILFANEFTITKDSVSGIYRIESLINKSKN